MTILNSTAYLSLFIQFITGLIDVWGLTLPTPSSVQIFRDLLIIELIVQVIEFIFYIWLIKNLNQPDITKYRYFDWFLTTPSMLITLMAFLSPPNKYTSVLDFLKANGSIVTQVLVLNWLMLTFGLLGEIGVLSQPVSATLGFIPFVLYFYLIYTHFTPNSLNQKRVYFYFLFFWSLYGVAAFLPYTQKNAMYNILDLFAKNFFGLFLVYILYTSKNI
jgi:hypothetical protein